MFKNEFQGGQFVEVFSAQGKDPTGAWKLQGGSGIRKVYEKEVKSYVYTLEGSVATTKMQLPKEMKQSLSLVQRYLVIQMNVPKGGEFSIEIGISDISNSKRRLSMSTSVREVGVTPLHAKLPLTVLRKSVWVNACIDLVSIVSETWAGQTFSKIESLSISANCKLRRVLTMRCQLTDNTDDDDLYGSSEPGDVIYDSLPRQCLLPNDVTYYNQVLNMHKIRAADYKVRGDRPSPLDLDLSSSGRRSHLAESFHIAFGTKVGKPPTAVSRKSTSTDLPSHRDSARFNGSGIVRESQDGHHLPRAFHPRNNPEWVESNRQRLSSDPGVLTEHIPTNRNSNPLNQSRSWSGAEMQQQKKMEAAAFTKPHPPPRDSSAEPAQRRKPKVRSGDRQHRTPADAHLKSSRGHHHTISAPAHSHSNRLEVQNSVSENSNTNNSMRFSRLNPIESRRKIPPLTAAAEAVNNQNHLSANGEKVPIVPPMKSADPEVSKLTAWRHRNLNQNIHTSNEEPKSTIQVSYEEDSVTDVIKALHEKVNEMSVEIEEEPEIRDENEDSEDEDRRDLIDSLEKFAADVHSSGSEDEGEGQQGLFQFRSPPKAAQSKEQKPGRVKNLRKALNRIENVEKSVADNSYNNSYDPAQYGLTAEPLLKPKPPSEPKQSETLQPKPPTSPFNNSRPNSGKRFRSGSRNSNSSNKPTPDSSGTAEDLKKHMKLYNEQKNLTDKLQKDLNEPQLDIIGNQVHAVQTAKKEELAVLPAIPSPRSSAQEPRVSSAGKRISSAGSKKSDESSRASSSLSKDEMKTPPHIHKLRTSDRPPSPPSSRGSTRLSRKSLREIPESDRRLLKAQYSSISPTNTMRSKKANDTFDEAEMLRYLKQEHETGSSLKEDKEEYRPRTRQYDHEVAMSEDGDHSSDDSFMTTSVPIMGTHDYKDEMHDTLERSDTRDNSVFSPPIVDRSADNLAHSDLSLSLNNSKSRKRLNYSNDPHLNSPLKHQQEEKEEEELDLLYDPVLDCYFDPKTCKYYELA